MYDYLIVGAGLFGAVFAYEARQRGKRCLVIDKREHAGGNVYTEHIEGINVHNMAPIFSIPIANRSGTMSISSLNSTAIPMPLWPITGGELYNLPFNMNTFHQLWGVVRPEDAKQRIEEQRQAAGITDPQNLEEQAISLVGTDIYEKLIKGYTEKQWGRSARDLPAFIIKRLPVRFTYDNNYFNDQYQGIPKGGYNVIIDKMLEGIEVRLQVDFFEQREELVKSAKKMVFTGMIDQYYDYRYGVLEYRSLQFETKFLSRTGNYQGNAVVNYTDRQTPYTRVIEHKHFEFGTQAGTVITEEYPTEWKPGLEPYYPINDEKNNEIYKQYKALADQESDVIFGGRLGGYKYYDMHQVIAEALTAAGRELGK